MANSPTLRLRPSEQQRIRIGRDPGCDFSFPDARNISRLHAEIRIKEGKLYLMDMNSVNGTWLNGVRLYREISARDLFYLFWNHNAAASEWVRKELQYALTQKTVDYIEPIPLEGPEVCPPPESLMGKHFNDWTLRYLGNQ